MTSPLRHAFTLQHIHLPGLTPYLTASRLQDHYVAQHLSYASTKSPRATSAPSFQNPPPKSPSRPPNPTLLTFQTPPTYTCGRREIASLTPSQINHLHHNGASFHEALRGGQTTFHGPGQLTAYLICSLRAHGFNTRSYVRLLEESVIATLAGYGVDGHTREDQPGVWVRTNHGSEEGFTEKDGGIEEEGIDGQRKIASVGVHLRRFVSSHGIGLNAYTDLEWFRRITACGLPGGWMTSMLVQKGGFGRLTGGQASTVAAGDAGEEAMEAAKGVMNVLAQGFAEAVARKLGGVDVVPEIVEVKDVFETVGHGLAKEPAGS